MREPGVSPGRSRRCKGKCSPATTPLGRDAWEGGGGGSPESEDLPLSDITSPSWKGEGDEFVSRRLALAAVTLVAVLVAAAAHSQPRTGTSYPVTITTKDSTTTITAKPKRIVSLAPTATESLFAVGAGPQVIAVDNQSDYPKSAPKTIALRLHAERRGDRGLQARPRRDLVRPQRVCPRRSEPSGSRSSCTTQRSRSRAPTSRSGSSARQPITTRRPTRSSRA